MVLDLGKDYYHLSDQGLSDLSAKVKAGNMEDVLKVYESEMRVSSAILPWRREFGLEADVGCRLNCWRIESRQERRHGQSDPDAVDPGSKDQSDSGLNILSHQRR